MEDKRNLSGREGARVVGGLLLVVAGGALLMRNLGYDLPYWLFTWPMILILIGIYSGFKHRFQNIGWIILIAVGVFFLIDDFIPNLKLQPAFWPLVIMGFGILFMIRPSKKKRIWDVKDRDENRGQNISASASQHTNFHSADKISQASTDKADFLKIDSVFSGVNRTILSKNFQGGKIACVFGGAEIDLTQADINGAAEIKVDVVFGGIKLIVPGNWGIQSYIDGAFHSVDDKRKYNSVIAVDPTKTLVLKGSAVFGGVEVKSY